MSGTIDDPTVASASILARAIRERRISSVEVLTAHLRRIEAVNPRLNAIVQQSPTALAEARDADAVIARGDDVGPLHGVPFTVKDWIETAGLICAAGWEQRRAYVPNRDATVAACGSPVGLGSDSGGSIRWPAHCCGVAELKPTNGLVPNTSHTPPISVLADPRTVIGPLARSATTTTSTRCRSA